MIFEKRREKWDEWMDRVGESAYIIAKGHEP